MHADYDTFASILDYLSNDRPALQAAAVVCKAWSLPCRRRLFDQVTVYADSAEVVELLGLVRQLPAVLARVRHLHIRGRSRTADSRFRNTHSVLCLWMISDITAGMPALSAISVSHVTLVTSGSVERLPVGIDFLASDVRLAGDGHGVRFGLDDFVPMQIPRLRLQRCMGSAAVLMNAAREVEEVYVEVGEAYDGPSTPGSGTSHGAHSLVARGADPRWLPLLKTIVHCNRLTLTEVQVGMAMCREMLSSTDCSSLAFRECPNLLRLAIELSMDMLPGSSKEIRCHDMLHTVIQVLPLHLASLQFAFIFSGWINDHEVRQTLQNVPWDQLIAAVDEHGRLAHLKLVLRAYFRRSLLTWDVALVQQLEQQWQTLGHCCALDLDADKGARDE